MVVVAIVGGPAPTELLEERLIPTFRDSAGWRLFDLARACLGDTDVALTPTAWMLATERYAIHTSHHDILSAIKRVVFDTRQGRPVLIVGTIALEHALVAACNNGEVFNGPVEDWMRKHNAFFLPHTHSQNRYWHKVNAFALASIVMRNFIEAGQRWATHSDHDTGTVVRATFQLAPQGNHNGA